ncbi:hypothetical protein [Paraburkholderia sp. UCT70]|uniref:hypothetical protein n=1 Tax=Paraburkholderia sp. UCT70 TaxID=2991068 RepID=UPI003D1DEAB7
MDAPVDQLHLTDDVALAVRANVAVITTLSAQIAIVEKRLQENVAHTRTAPSLLQYPALDKRLRP